MCVAQKVQILCQNDHQNIKWIELSWTAFSQQLALTWNALFMNIFNSYRTIFFPVNISQDIVKKLRFYHIRKPRKKIWSIEIVLIKKINIFCYWNRVLYSLPGPTYSFFCILYWNLSQTLEILLPHLLPVGFRNSRYIIYL